MLYWNGSQMVSIPDVVIPAPENHKPLPKVPTISGKQVADSIATYRPTTTTWGNVAPVSDDRSEL